MNKGEEDSPSSYVSLSVQVKIPESCPLNTEVKQNSMIKAETDHLNIDILKPAQMASTQTKKAAYQMTEEEDA